MGEVTQADRESAEDAYFSCFEPQPNNLWLKAMLDGKHDDDEVVQFCRRHRLAHTPQDDAADTVERVARALQQVCDEITPAKAYAESCGLEGGKFPSVVHIKLDMIHGYAREGLTALAAMRASS
jgi:hypothetical protein